LRGKEAGRKRGKREKKTGSAWYDRERRTRVTIYIKTQAMGGDEYFKQGTYEGKRGPGRESTFK